MSIEYVTHVKKLRNAKGQSDIGATFRLLEQEVNRLNALITMQSQEIALLKQQNVAQDHHINDLRTTQSTFRAAFEHQLFPNRQLAAGDGGEAH